MDQLEQYKTSSLLRSNAYYNDTELQQAKQVFYEKSIKAKYPYNFFWMGVPIIQEPTDIMALQEIICETKPEFIIETGIAWGGLLVFSASMLALLGDDELRFVYGIDIDIRPHTHKIIKQHPLKNKIIMIEGSSIEQDVIGHVTRLFSEAKVMVILDSNHTHDHVLAELRAYAPLVSKGCYCVVCDTAIEDLPGEMPGRPWGKGNNPKTAVWQFLKENDNFKIDREIESKLIITGSPDGFLRKIK